MEPFTSLSVSSNIDRLCDPVPSITIDETGQSQTDQVLLNRWSLALKQGVVLKPARSVKESSDLNCVELSTIIVITVGLLLLLTPIALFFFLSSCFLSLFPPFSSCWILNQPFVERHSSLDYLPSTHQSKWCCSSALGSSGLAVQEGVLRTCAQQVSHFPHMKQQQQ